MAWPRFPGGSGMALGFAAGVGCTIVAVASGAAGHHQLGLIVIAIGVVTVSALTTVVGAVLTGAQCWLLYASFILGRAGEVVLDRTSARAAGELIAAALLATMLGAAIKGGRRQSLIPRQVSRAGYPDRASRRGYIGRSCSRPSNDADNGFDPQVFR
jgi:hypothetical protein